MADKIYWNIIFVKLKIWKCSLYRYYDYIYIAMCNKNRGLFLFYYLLLYFYYVYSLLVKYRPHFYIE